MACHSQNPRVSRGFMQVIRPASEQMVIDPITGNQTIARLVSHVLIMRPMSRWERFYHRITFCGCLN